MDANVNPNPTDTPTPMVWACAAMHDLSERRGLWYSEPVPLGNESASTLVVVAGREGNDWRFEITVGETMTREKLNNLLNCLSCARWAQDYYRGFTGEPFNESLYPTLTPKPST